MLLSVSQFEVAAADTSDCVRKEREENWLWLVDAEICQCSSHQEKRKRLRRRQACRLECPDRLSKNNATATHPSSLATATNKAAREV